MTPKSQIIQCAQYVLLLAASLAWGSVQCQEAADKPGALPPETRIRVMSYNIHHGEGIDGQLDLDRIARLIREARAEIVALQEVDRGVDRTEGRDLAAELAELTGLTALFSNNHSFQGGEYGNALLSAFPVRHWTNHHYRMFQSQEQRGLLQAVLEVHGQPVLILNTHLDFQRDPRERLAHIEELRTVAAGYGAMPTIIAGDFNATPDSPTHAAMVEHFQDVWAHAGEGPGWTSPSETPKRRIDYLFVSDLAQLHPLKVWTISSPASDHLPLVAEVELKP